MTNDRIGEFFSYMDDMTPEQLDERIKQIRNERRSYKKKASKVKKESVKASEKLKVLMSGLSDEEVAALLKELDDERG